MLVVFNAAREKNSILLSKKNKNKKDDVCEARDTPQAAVNMFIESKSLGDGSLAALTASARC